MNPVSLFSSLYVGNTGLQVSQNSLNTTSHNLANVGTTGYTRQQVIITDTHYNKIGTSAFGTNQVGYGTSISAVMTYRDYFLDASYRECVGRQGFYKAQYEATSEVENLLGEMEGAKFQQTIGNVYSAMQEIAKDPGNIVARTNFIQFSQSFIERAGNIQKQLAEYQKNLNENITQQVKTINSIGQKIFELNREIAAAEAGNIERANDFRDQRDLLLDQLGELVKIDYEEGPDKKVTVRIEGVTFVNEVGFYEMGLTKATNEEPLISPTWPYLGGREVFNLDIPIATDADTDVGYLKGLIISRGTRETTYADIPVRENFATDDDFNKAVKEYNKNISSSSIMMIQAQLDQFVHGVVTMINDTLCPNKTITAANGKTYTVLDEEKAPMGMDEDKTVGMELFERTNTKRYEKKIIDGKEYMVYNEEDPDDLSSLYSISQLRINPEILENYSKLPLSSNDNSGGFDMKVGQSMLEKWGSEFSSLGPGELAKFNFSDYYTNMVGALANRGNEYATKAKSQDTMKLMIENQRQSVIGVSSDEELTNLIRFQHSYNAASRYITTVNNMLETLLNAV